MGGRSQGPWARFLCWLSGGGRVAAIFQTRGCENPSPPPPAANRNCFSECSERLRVGIDSLLYQEGQLHCRSSLSPFHRGLRTPGLHLDTEPWHRLHADQG